MTMTIDRLVQDASVQLLGRECRIPGTGFGLLHAMSVQGVPLVQHNAASEAVECPGAVPLPVMGELVRILAAGEDGPVLSGCWMGYSPHPMASQETVTVRVLRGTAVISREVPYAALHAGTVVTGVASPETKDAITAAECLAANLRCQRREHADFLVRLAEDARQYADDNDLCGRFDDFMEEHGFDRREQEYEVEIEFEPVTLRGVMASSQEAADNSVDDEDVRRALGRSGALPEWNVR